MELLKEILFLLQTHLFIRVLVVLVASVLLAKLVDWFMTRVLRRLTSRTKTHLDDRILDMLHKPVFYSVLLMGVVIAVQMLNLPAPLHFVSSALVKTLVVLLWLSLGIRATLLFLDWMTQHTERFQFVQPATKPLFDIAAKLILIGGAAYFVLISWKVDVTAWLASAGILGIAVGFAAKDTLANLFAGVFILADSPYKVGDYIVLDGGFRGRVTRIGLRSTRVLTRDDVEITIPNATIANSKILNESGGPHLKHRIRTSVGVAYGTDIDQLKKVLQQVIETACKEGHICQDPEARIRFRGFGDSALMFDLLSWIHRPEERGRVQDHLNTSIYKALGSAQIEIPYPKRDVYVKQLPREAGS